MANIIKAGQQKARDARNKANRSPEQVIAQGQQKVADERAARKQCADKGGKWVNGQCILPEVKAKEEPTELTQGQVAVNGKVIDVDTGNGIKKDSFGNVIGIEGGFRRENLSEEELKEVEGFELEKKEAELLAEKEEAEEKQEEAEQLDIEEQIKRAKEANKEKAKQDADITQRQAQAAAPTMGAFGSTTAASEATGRGIESKLKLATRQQQRRFDEVSQNIRTTERKLQERRGKMDRAERVAMILEQKQNQKALESLEEELEEAANTEAGKTVDFFGKMSDEALSALTDDDILSFEESFEAAGRPTGQISALVAKAQQRQRATEELLKDPENQELQNKVAILNGQFDKIKSESVGGVEGTANIKNLNFLKKLEESNDPLAKEFRELIGVDEVESTPSVSQTSVPSSTSVFSITEGTTDRIPDVNNNPGNIKAGGSADKFAARDSNGNLILSNRGEGNFLTFENPEDGFNALMTDISAKQTGNTRTALNANSTLLDFAKIYANAGQEYVDNIVREGNINSNLRLGAIDTFDLAKGISAAEGFTGIVKGGEDVGVSDVDKDIAKIQIGKAAFGTRISDNEGKKVDSIIESIVKANPNITAGELRDNVIDKLLGFVVTDNQDFGDAIKDVFITNAGENGLAGVDARGISRLINEGKLEAALTKAENFAMKEAKQNDPDGFIGEPTAKLAVQRSRNLQDLVEGLEESPIGVVGGTFEEFLGRLKGKDAQVVKGKIIAQVAEMRNKLSGTAVTPSEEEFLRDIIPRLGDSPENFILKLEQLREMPLDKLNSVRGSVLLKDLDEETLLDKNKRINLYREEQTVQEPVQEEPLFKTSSGFSFTPSEKSVITSEDELELDEIFNQE